MGMGSLSKGVVPTAGERLEAAGPGRRKPAAGEGDLMVVEQRS